jgi:hypothetical protein
MRFGALFGTLTFALALTACARLPHRIPAGDILIADAVTLSLPGPAEMDQRLRATQILSGRYEDRTFDIQLNIEWRADAIVLAAFSLFGNTLFSMTYDGDSITTVGNGLVVRGLDVTYILGDILITYGSRELLESRLHGVEVEVVDSPQRRSILRAGTPVVIVQYQGASRWEGTVRFRHLERNYEYEIDTAQVSFQ